MGADCMGLYVQWAPKLKPRAVVALLVAAVLFVQPIIITFHTTIANASDPPSVDTANIHFINSPQYVREANGSDLGAQLITYANTTSVEFYVDGNTSVPIGGTDYGVSSIGYHEWRFAAPLAGGQHTITGRVMIDNNWYLITGSALVYSLDIPSASYISPTDQNNMFRPGDNPVRIKVDDEFNQFKSAEFSLYNYTMATHTFGALIGTFTINRAQCDLQDAGASVLCDIGAAANWGNLSAGSYAVKLATSTQASSGINTTMDQYWSPAFTIDILPPELQSFALENSPTGIVDGAVDVVAQATDNTAVESVDFYLTLPRAEDGVCTGDGNKLAESRITAADMDGMYRAHIGTSFLAEGDYCITATARDSAMNSSEPKYLKIAVDHATPHPTVTIDSNATGRTVTGTVSVASAAFRVMIDGTSRDDVTVQVGEQAGSSYKWSLTLPADVASGLDHTVEIIATVDGVDSDPVQATITLVDNNDPGGGSGILPIEMTDPLLNQLKDKLNQPFLVPASFGSISSPQLFRTAAQSQADTAILGAQTAKDPVTDLNTKAGAAVPTENGWKFFGLLWYWWALLAAVGVAWFAARRRRLNAAVSSLTNTNAEQELG